MSSGEEPTEPTQFEVELQTDANTSNDNAMPTLRPYDQTPITPGEKKNTAKRPCTELSPLNECEMIEFLLFTIARYQRHSQKSRHSIQC